VCATFAHAKPCYKADGACERRCVHTVVKGDRVAYFSADRVMELHAGRSEVRAQFADLRERFFLHTYKTEKGGEHAKHGSVDAISNAKSLGILLRGFRTG